MAGDSSDQNAAASITPADAPSSPSNTSCLMFLQQNTIAAPAAVIPHVKRVASSACKGCGSCEKACIITKTPSFGFEPSYDVIIRRVKKFLTAIGIA